MNTLDRRGLKAASAERLSQAPLAQRIILIWAGASAGISLLVSFLSFLLDSQIELTGGLSGIGLRSLLTSAQSFLSLAVLLAMPFWEVGLLWTSLQVVRGQETRFSMLTKGFFRIGPVVRLLLLRVALLFGVMMVCSHAAGILTVVVPVSKEALEAVVQVEQTILSDPAAAIDPAQLELFWQAMLPSFVVSLLLTAGVWVYLAYRFRLADYLVIDREKIGALAALVYSNHLTKGNKRALLKLDLRLWWYYVLLLLVNLLAYADLLLPALGVALPVSKEVAYWVFYGLSVAGQLALAWYAVPYVQTVYAKAYDTLRRQDDLPAVS